MNEVYRILISEGFSSDAAREKREVKKFLPHCIFKKVDTEADFLQALEEFMPDLILSEYQIPNFDGLNALKLTLEITPSTPLIIVTSSIKENAAIECLKAGAANYILKEHIKSLGPAVFKTLENQKVQKKLIESEERFRKIFEDNAEVKLLIDFTTGNIIDGNKAAAEYYGWTKEELSHMNLNEINILSPEIFKEELDNASRQKKIRLEFRHRLKDGSVRDVEVFSSKIDIGRKEYLHSIIHDITDQKRMEEELRESEERFRLVFENVFDGISIYVEDPDPYKRKLVDCNKQYARMAGRTRKELLTLGNTLGLQKTLEDKANENRLESIEMEKAFQGSFSWIRPDGKENVIEYVGMPITWRGKAYTIGIDRDITEQKKILEELIVAKENAEQSDKLKSEFLSQVSHEIRTPLVSMVNYTDLIRDDMKAGNITGLPEYLESLSDAGRRMQRTFDLIVNAAQILTNNFEPKFKSVNLINEILIHVYNEFENQAKQKQLDYIFWDNSKDQNIIADKYSLNQLFSNLLDNAIKYTKEGFVKLEVTQVDDTILVKVSDSGIGISSDFLPHIFEPFRQEDQGYTRKYEGNGLGLTLVKKYCELNGAEINVASVKDRGSTFTVKFKLMRRD